MSINEIVKRISQGGRNGVRKTEVKKEFQTIDVEEAVQSLIGNGDIVMDKKGTAYYLWQISDYLDYLLVTDAKFRLLYNKIEGIKVLLGKKMEHDLVPNSTGSTGNSFSSGGPSDDLAELVQEDTLDKDSFRQEFDLALRKYSSSSGWVPLNRIREEMERKYNIRRDEFYSQVENLTNNARETYELSSGGVEGITIRGILHGLVRCI